MTETPERTATEAKATLYALADGRVNVALLDAGLVGLARLAGRWAEEKGHLLDQFFSAAMHGYAAAWADILGADVTTMLAAVTVDP